MKTNKILLFLVAVGLLGGNMVAMNKCEEELLRTNKHNDLVWQYLLSFNCKEMSVKGIKQFILTKKICIRKKDSLGNTAIYSLASRGPLFDDTRVIEIFSMLLDIGAVTEEDIKEWCKKLKTLDPKKYAVTFYGRLSLEGVEGYMPVLHYLLLKVVLDDNPSYDFELCKKLLSRGKLFESEDLCLIRVFIGERIIELAKKMREVACKSDNALWVWVMKQFNKSEAVHWKGPKYKAFVDEHGDSGPVTSCISRILDEYENEEAGGVVLVAKNIISVLDELNIDHKLWWRFRVVALFELVNDLITGESEMARQDLLERTRFLINMANTQDVGQEEEDEGGVLGDVFDIRFIDGKLVRVPSKLFLSQK